MDLQKEREAFEAWFESRYDAHFMQFALDLDMYADKHTQTCWEAWQAAKAESHKSASLYQLEINHLASANQQLRDYAAKAQAVQQWISVKDEMPEQGQKVLVFRPHAHEKPYKDPNYKICTYAGEDIFINSHFEHEITHWMPLPKPPTKECK